MMIQPKALLADIQGAMAIETAFLVPILATLSIGGFEASQMIARHGELQSAAAEASAIVQASPPETDEERAVVEDVIEASTGLPDESVTLELTYRCGTQENYSQSRLICLGDDATDDDDEDEGGYTTEEISTYIRIRIKDAYTPQWVHFGIGETINYDVQRTVQTS